MDELIEKLERATGPDRELDAEIWRAVYAPHAWIERAPNGVWCVYEKPAYGKRDKSLVANKPGQQSWPCEYTSSLDAALTLVPDPWFWWIGHLDQTDRRFVATVSERAVVDHPGFRGFSKTPAIAMCLAALKARTSMESNHD